MSSKYLDKNLDALRTLNPHLAETLENTQADTTYTGSIEAKTGQLVPCFSGDTPANSRINPIIESERAISHIEKNNFLFFLGITGGFHIRAFLNRFPQGYCVAAERDLPALKSLLSVIPLWDILSCKRVTLLPDLNPTTIVSELTQRYLPALYGSFTSYSPRSWSQRFFGEEQKIAVSNALTHISRDYSVQAHFGRVWFSNFIKNLSLMNQSFSYTDRVDSNKTALIVAAGPSIDQELIKIKENRSLYIIFSTDTALGALKGYGITPDYFITIDPQYYSSLHAYSSLSPKTTVIVDCCANPTLISLAYRTGCQILFTVGGHPLGEYAASFSPLPYMDTSSGTVTVAAKHVAYSLGYEKIKVIGADFSYLGGKSYAKGTYLADLFDNQSNRINPAESAYTALIFRTPVERSAYNSGYSYTTDTLLSYKAELAAWKPGNKWNNKEFSLFPTKKFATVLIKSLKTLSEQKEMCGPLFLAMIPFFAWFQNRYSLSCEQKNQKKAIELALEMIAGYTS